MDRNGAFIGMGHGSEIPAIVPLTSATTGGRRVGYCTNVHAGADLETTRANLQRWAVAVRQRVCPRGAMGLGLWLSAPTAAKLLADGQVQEFADWLTEAGLTPFTLNGFPYGDFHQRVVKHRVYEPTWREQARFDYTRDLIAIHDALLPPGAEGSISTLPLCWGNPRPSEEALAQAADLLWQTAEALARREAESGRLIYLCLEPEPGCVLERSEDVVRFFKDHLLRGLSGSQAATVRRHLRVCHDICHAAVMFEDQGEAIDRYLAAGVLVGKVQVSSAICLPLDEMGPEQRSAALAQLAGVVEERYLHQTVVQSSPHGATTFYEDLPDALASVAATDAADCGGQWRVHFHVPVYLRQFGHLQTSQSQIVDCLRAARRCEGLSHFEVETYAWNVLPEELQQADLAEGIARELLWFQERCEEEDA